jgi:hypothetical protein
MRYIAFILFLFFFGSAYNSHAQSDKPDFKVIAFYTARNDQAHISWVHEANRWFPQMGKKYHFSYDSTKDWSNMNPGFLAQYQVVLFLDTRPDSPAQREAFRQYMENGGGWMGFHFAAFALTPSDFPANWDWYHNQFLGSGSYVSNTWRPTSAVLRVEDRQFSSDARQTTDRHAGSDGPQTADRYSSITKGLPTTFKSSPNEWYRWEKDLRKNPDIEILLSIDSTSFPLGTGPKLYEIWHSGYYPVVWTNKHYKMVYFNMGHNDIDYEHKTNKELSFTLDNEIQDSLLINALLWTGRGRK